MSCKESGKMKKVCISTYCEWSSYGSVLQAMGLKQALQEIDRKSFIVRDTPAPVAQKHFSFRVCANPRALLNEIRNTRARRKKDILYRNSVEFINHHVDIQYYNDFETLCKNIPDADFYLAGSDQIWHPNLCKKAFFLDFVPVDTKRLSYAASMGIEKIPQEKESEFHKLISKMETISVREADAAEIIRRYTDKPICRHIDPTFLVDQAFWRRVSREYPIKTPYILVYAIYWDVAYNRELKELHKKTGYDIVALCPSGRSRVWANKRIYDADPGQFLYLVDHAQAVVSSSFHGVALSVNLNKKIAAIINPNAPSRLTTLLSVLGIRKRNITEVMQFDLADYDRINKKIEQEKQASMQYLTEVLK